MFLVQNMIEKHQVVQLLSPKCTWFMQHQVVHVFEQFWASEYFIPFRNDDWKSNIFSVNQSLVRKQFNINPETKQLKKMVLFLIFYAVLWLQIYQDNAVLW
jgi:hypothetical protein